MYSLPLIYPQNTEFDNKLYDMILLISFTKSKNCFCVKVYYILYINIELYITF